MPIKPYKHNYVLDSEGKPLLDADGKGVLVDPGAEKVEYNSKLPKSNPIPMPPLTHSQRRMRELGMDPLEGLKSNLELITREVEYWEKVRMGKVLKADGHLVRYSSVAHAAMIGLQQKAHNELMRYEYARVPESMEIEVKEHRGMTIQLPREDGTYGDLDD